MLLFGSFARFGALVLAMPALGARGLDVAAEGASGLLAGGSVCEGAKGLDEGVGEGASGLNWALFEERLGN